MKMIRAASLSLLALATVSGAHYAGAAPLMQKYCQVPPYVIQNVSPNVLFLLDTSTSMKLLAYHDNVDDAASGGYCFNSASPCTGFDNNQSYVGYFETGAWYTAGANSFTKAGAKDNVAKQSDYWDGNFLNWLTMRRIDIVRWALTGGKPSGSTVVAEGQGIDPAVDGGYKRVSNVERYADSTRFTGSDALFTMEATGGTAKLTVTTTSPPRSFTYKVAVDITKSPSGVLQEVLGARGRPGLEFFDVGNPGGQIQVAVGKTALSSVINEMNLSNQGNTTTPLGESLWGAAGYLARQAAIAAMGGTGPGAGGTGPEYSSGKLKLTSATFDPMNFDGVYPKCARNFVILLTDGEPCGDTHLPANFSTAWATGRTDYVCSDNQCLADSRGFFAPDTISNIGCTGGGNMAGLEKVALWSHVTDLRNAAGSPSVGIDTIPGMQNLTLYVINAFGRENNLILKYAAINGGFEFDNTVNAIDNSPMPSYSDAATRNWDLDRNGKPDTYFFASNGAELVQALKDALASMLKRASSGTAASVLASGEGSGANLVQAVFYPRRAFGSDVLLWTGGLHNLWYYVDPFFSNSSIRHDNSRTHLVPDKVLNLRQDDIVTLRFDQPSQTTVADLSQDSNGDGVADGDPYSTVKFEKLKYLWEAGKVLYNRVVDETKPGHRGRDIYFTDNTNQLKAFSPANRSELRPLMRLGTDDSAELIIRYVHGQDFFIPDNNGINQIRERAALIDNPVTGTIDNNVWKLADIINSTPRISSWIPLNKYDRNYDDFHYKRWTQDNTDSGSYRRRGLVFTGSNDGVLHAFRLGKLELTWSGQGRYDKARLTNDNTTSPMGDEVWAFVPRNALPYMAAQLLPDYCHLYTADLTPYVFDASLGEMGSDQSVTSAQGINDNTSWRTILIGGMRTGGGCKSPFDLTCTEGPGAAATCVKTPAVGMGSSSYYALDVTDQWHPKFLWEFSGFNTNTGRGGTGHPQNTLGFATSGPAIVKRYGTDRSRNGHWYAVFGSGPTGPIDNNYNQFLGRSDQPLRFFVLDLKTGELVKTIESFSNDPSGPAPIPFAFSSTLYNASADANLDYQDDVIYFGYTKRTGSAGAYTWTDGGIGRITLTDDPDTWSGSIIADGIGPVTSGIARLRNKNYDTMWLYFGTGRYFYEIDYTNSDDMSGQRHLFGIKDPCFRLGAYDNSCITKAGALTDVTSVSNVPQEGVANLPGFHGWYIRLDPSGSYVYDNTTSRFRSERVITDTVSTTSGLAFFTTYKPYAEECGMGGKSFLWAVKYNTGGAPGNLAIGKALVQVSTASVEQIDMRSAYNRTGPGFDPRKSDAMEGVPPTAQGLSILTPPPPLNRVLHIRER